jgi:pimeloyl-ACP methyl ester carboxylesterase
MSAASPRPVATKKSTNVRSRQIALAGSAVRAVQTVAPTTAARLVAHLFRRPQRHRRPTREYAWMLDATPLTLRVGGREVRAWARGEGPVVVLVHGWSGRGSQMGAFIEPLVRQGHRVITFDGPAHGASSGTLATPPDFAETLQTLQKVVGPFHGVIAHSFGTLATQLALADGLSATRVAYVAPSHSPRDAVRTVAGMLGLENRLLPLMEQMVSTASGRPIDDVQRAMSFDARVPALVVHDVDDDVIAPAVGQQLAEGIQRGMYLQTEGLGHYRVLRDREVVRQVVAFMADVDVDEVSWLTPLEAELELMGVI